MSEKIVPERTYYTVFAALIAVTLVTVTVSFLDLGPWHTVAGLIFGIIKATLVILFFMHLLYSSKLSWLAFASGLFWLGILMALTLSDYLTRHWLVY